MNGSVLLDTNIIIDIFKNDVGVIQAINTAESLFISSISLGELFYGAYNSSRLTSHLKETKEVSKSINVLAVGKTTADHYGKIKTQLRKKGRPVPENDIWIAAIAMQFDLTLITKDKHFSEIEGLKLELWSVKS